MSSMRARSLPRVREALEKAERARFYKQRSNKYTDEVRLVQNLAGLENERVSALARIKHQTLELRMQALRIRDEELEFLESDSARMEELAKKVEVNKQRNFLQDVKYKPKRTRQQFVDRYERWKAEDAAAEDWRLQPPPREPQVQLEEQLIYPAKRQRGHHRRQYRELMRRPDSQLGDKAVRSLRDLYSDEDGGRTDADRAFFQELEMELSSARDAAAAEEAAEAEEPSPFVTQQLRLVQAVQERSMERILQQIEATRRAIRFWEVPHSEDTRGLLGDCCLRRRFRVRRLRPRATAAAAVDGGVAANDDASAVEAEAGKPESTTDDEAGTRLTQVSEGVGGGSDQADEAAEAAEGADEVGEDSDEERERVRRLSRRLSRGFRPDEFNRRRQSLLKELEDEDVSPEERQQRMREFEKAWAEVLKCKYIRGYEPPDMRLPEGQTATDFVFGETQAHVLERIVEEASAAAADLREADAEAE